MFSRLFCVVFLSVIGFSHGAHAIDNKDLMEYCTVVERTGYDFTRTNSTNDEWDFMLCTGYMIGVTHTFYFNCEDAKNQNMWQDSGQTNVFRELYSASTSDPDAATQAFLNWIRKNPDMWDKDATASLWKWLPKTFPCS